jgi:hypothetical protein
MADQRINVLMVEDSEDDTRLLLKELRRAGYDVTHERVETKEAMLQALARQPWDLILADYTLPQFSGLKALQVFRESGLDIPFILVSGTVSEQAAIDIMRAGAHDFIIKDKLGRLVPAIQRELQEAKIREEKSRAVEALRESEELYRSLVDASPDAILVTDEHIEVILVNQQTLSLLGAHDAAEVIGASAYELILPEERERAVIDVQRMRELGEISRNVEYCLLRRDGLRVPIESSSSPIRGVNGKPSGFIVILRDITERKQARQALEREQAFLSSAIELLPFPIIFSTLEGEVIRANQASYQFLGDADMQGRQHRQLLEPTSRAPIPKDRWPMARAARGEVVSTVEAILMLADGREVPVLAHAAPVYVDDRLTATVVAFQDITALKAVDKAKNDFLAVLSHELRTPLTSILGWAEEAEITPEIVPEALAVIRKNAEIQRRMLENLLEVSRMIHGQLRLECVPSDLWGLAETTVQHWQTLAEERRITLVFDPPASPLPIEADRKRLQAVLANLLDNAMRYTPPGGTIHLTGKRLEHAAMLTIQDSGQGIAAEDLPHIFTLFRGIGSAEGRGGLGLGLALAKCIIELHGGRITAASPEIGHGSTFTIVVPLLSEGP